MDSVFRSATARAVFSLCLPLFAIVLAGCAAVGPDHVRPEIPLRETWHSRLGSGLSNHEADARSMAAWWATLNDPKLSQLMDYAVSGNLDLKKARARVREARARRRIAEAALFPSVTGSASASWSDTYKGVGPDTTGELYTAGFDAGWELDIFGGVRRSVEAAQRDLEAREEGLRNVLVTLLAEVALNYLDVRTYQERLSVAEGNLDSQSETYRLTQWRYEAGLSDELAVQQALYNLENTRSQIPVLRTGLEAAMNRVAILLGEQPGALHGELEQREPITVPPLQVAVGVPADLVRRRPDVRQAEKELAAQTARVGVATAELYPKFTLNGSIGLESLSLSNLSSGTLSVVGGPAVTWSIFKGGATRQNIEVQSALQEQALIEYETTLMEALEEVENALIAYAEVQERRQSLSVATEAAQAAARLAQQKYEAGLTDFTDVLVAQRSVLSLQEQLVLSNWNVAGNLVRLYKALGGGWTLPANEG
ncbi:MAG: TolC family protein [Deltaproteobacteria bacterium]|nr:TolC family protein [Deltaproteobacteria bacterium]